MLIDIRRSCYTITKAATATAAAAAAAAAAATTATAAAATGAAEAMSHRQSSKKSKKHHEPQIEYIIDTTDKLGSLSVGKGHVRSVVPYIQEFITFAKGRWIGRELLEIFTREFGGHPRNYWINAIEGGRVKVNSKVVNKSYRLKNGDAILHRTHRHEPPVFGRITFVGESEYCLAVSKPPSMPMHPSGAYRFNSLENILKAEPLVPSQPPLYLVHRLDRVTSGLVIFAKSKGMSV